MKTILLLIAYSLLIFDTHAHGVANVAKQADLSEFNTIRKDIIASTSNDFDPIILAKTGKFVQRKEAEPLQQIIFLLGFAVFILLAGTIHNLFPISKYILSFNSLFFIKKVKKQIS